MLITIYIRLQNALTYFGAIVIYFGSGTVLGWTTNWKIPELGNPPK
jgi:hypothetical protein